MKNKGITIDFNPDYVKGKSEEQIKAEHKHLADDGHDLDLALAEHYKKHPKEAEPAKKPDKVKVDN